MPSARRLAKCLAAALVPALFLLTGCAPTGGKVAETKYRKTYYLDANLGFAVEHPADWPRLGPDDTGTVRWSPPAASQAEGVEMAVTSLPPERAAGGQQRLLADFTAALPGFVLIDRAEIEVGTDHIPARQLLGHTPTRTWLLLAVTSNRRAFVLAFCAPPEAFDHWRPIFTEMVESFTQLE